MRRWLFSLLLLAPASAWGQGSVQFFDAQSGRPVQGSFQKADPDEGPAVAIEVRMIRTRLEGCILGSCRRVPHVFAMHKGSGGIIGYRQKKAEWLVVTNAHVVRADPRAERIEVYVASAAQWREARIIGTDPQVDLALLGFASPGRHQVCPIAAEPPPDGAKVRTFGFTGGSQFSPRTTTIHRTLPVGIGANRSQPGRYFARCIFNQGESGGAVILDGATVGVIQAVEMDERTNQPSGIGLVVAWEELSDFCGRFGWEPPPASPPAIVERDPPLRIPAPAAPADQAPAADEPVEQPSINAAGLPPEKAREEPSENSRPSGGIVGALSKGDGIWNLGIKLAIALGLLSPAGLTGLTGILAYGGFRLFRRIIRKRLLPKFSGGQGQEPPANVAKPAPPPAPPIWPSTQIEVSASSSAPVGSPPCASSPAEFRGLQRQLDELRTMLAQKSPAAGSPGLQLPQNFYSTIELQTYAEAVAWAKARLVERYPGAMGTMQTLDSLVQQYLSAQKGSKA